MWKTIVSILMLMLLLVGCQLGTKEKAVVLFSTSEVQAMSQTISLKFVGDVMFAGKVNDILRAKGYDYPYQQVGSHLRNADLTAINLETSVSTRGVPASKEYVYRSEPVNMKFLAEKAGVDIVTLANNHSMDYGTTALIDTFKHLTDQQIAYVGAGRDRKRALQPIYLSGKGIRVGFVGFSRVVPGSSWKAGVGKPGTADTYETREAVKSIRTANSQADLVVVLIHWGVERSDRPEPYQKKMAREFIDAGADLVIGSHPHVLQGFEQYKGKWIAYSLGNFIFTTNTNAKTWDSAILGAVCDIKAMCELQMTPVRTKFALPVILKGNEAQTLLRRISSISLNAKIDSAGKIQLRK